MLAMCRFTVGVLLLILCCGNGLAQSYSKTNGKSRVDLGRLERVAELVERYVQEGKHAGVSYVVMIDGHQIDSGQYGLKNMAQGHPMTKDTIFRIYSMTKVLTSVAALQLFEQGKLNLTDDITQWLPELKELQVYEEGRLGGTRVPLDQAITVRMLLNHTAGFTYDFFEGSKVHELYKQENLWESNSLDEFISKVAKLPLISQPGTEFHYGIGLDVMGLIIERISGQTFPEYLREHITAPLHMVDTGFYVDKDDMHRLSSVHQMGEHGQLENASPILGAYAEKGRGIPSGGGGLFSTISDYAQFAQMLLNKGEMNRTRILGRKTLELALENSLTETKNPYNEFSQSDGWGLLGAVRLHVGASQELGSRGMFYWSGAATTHFFVDPEESLVGLVFAQHIPFDQYQLFAPFRNAIYQALK